MSLVISGWFPTVSWLVCNLYIDLLQWYCPFLNPPMINLHVPRTNLALSSRSFHTAASTICSTLSSYIPLSQTLHSFSSHLKTHFFQSALNSSSSDLWFTLKIVAIYKCFFLLLTCVKKSPDGWLPVHWDQLRAERSVTSMGEIYLSVCSRQQSRHWRESRGVEWCTKTCWSSRCAVLWD